MPDVTWRLHTERNAFDLTRDVWLVCEGRAGPSAVEFVFRPFPEGARPTIERSAHLDERSFCNLMQAFLDEAWKLGMRPAGFADTEGTLAATRQHLEDMRLLAGVHAKQKALR